MGQQPQARRILRIARGNQSNPDAPGPLHLALGGCGDFGIQHAPDADRTHAGNRLQLRRRGFENALRRPEMLDQRVGEAGTDTGRERQPNPCLKRGGGR
jgi:hypothetical protein